MSSNIINIIERFQTRHALQEEDEMKNLNASPDSEATQKVAGRNGMPKNGLSETQKGINTKEIPITGKK
jgi:hypothetical protein